MKAIFTLVASLAFFALFLTGCSHETKSALEKLEADTSLSDEQAVVKMAEASWMYKTKDNEKFTASKKKNGKLLLTGMTKDDLNMTVLNQKTFRQVEMEEDAKYMWRLFRSASKRNLDEMVFTHKQAILNNPDFTIYRVRLTMAQLKGIPGWDTADPYDVGEHDLLDTDEARNVVKTIVSKWTIEVDNTDKVKIK